MSETAWCDRRKVSVYILLIGFKFFGADRDAAGRGKKFLKFSTHASQQKEEYENFMSDRQTTNDYHHHQQKLSFDALVRSCVINHRVWLEEKSVRWKKN